MGSKFYAHSLPGQPIEEWQPLEDHLDNVAKMAAEFAGFFGAESWGSIAGYHHDLGKRKNAWQAYLRNANKMVDDFAQYYSGRVGHSDSGAQWLYVRSKEAGKLLAYCIAGHHGGLPNWDDTASRALKSRLGKESPE
jgi:CRISPR-associated endonuclease/helicase Cas3